MSQTESDGAALSGHILVVNHQFEHEIIVALLNLLAGEGRRFGEREYTELDFSRAIGVAHSSGLVRDRYGEHSFSQSQPLFLSDLGLPVTFFDHPELGRCVDVLEFERALGKPGICAAAIEFVNERKGTDTRHLRWKEYPNPSHFRTEESEVNDDANLELDRLALLKRNEPNNWLGLHRVTQIIFNTREGGEESFGIIRVRTSGGDVLDMLYALLKARRDGLPTENLRPEVPPSVSGRRDRRAPYYELMPTLGERINVIRNEFDIDVALHENADDELTLSGPDSCALAVELVSVVRAYEVRHRKLVANFVLGVGNLINIPSGAVLLTALSEVELPTLSEAALVSENGFAWAFIVTLWAPIWMLKRLVSYRWLMTAA